MDIVDKGTNWISEEGVLIQVREDGSFEQGSNCRGKILALAKGEVAFDNN